MRTETGAAVLLVLAIGVALIWANAPGGGGYEALWTTTVLARVGALELATDLRGCVNEGLMTLFFLVVGLEAKRELDLGQLRDRRGLTVPVVAGLTGIVASTAIYLLVTAGRSGAGGWGIAVSTDTALSLAALTLLVGAQAPRLRVFLLTVLVVDDVVALVVLTIVYPGPLDPAGVAAAVVLLALLLALRAYGRRRQAEVDGGVALYAASVLVGIGLWLALFTSGIDPVVSGLLIGLLTSAHTPQRPRVERGMQLAHSFGEEPTPSLAYTASARLTGAISPNDRLQYRLHPWTSLVIVPIFALANAGIALDAGALAGALRSPITWGVLLAFVVGKPTGILAAAWLTARGAPRTGRLTVSWRELRGTASASGIGFTVSLLIAARAFDGAALDQAKIGILATAVLSPVVAAVSLRRKNARDGLTNTA